MTDISTRDLCPTQRRLLLVACAEPKTLGELLLDAGIDSPSVSPYRRFLTSLVVRGLLSQTQNQRGERGRVYYYAITREGEQVADWIFAHQQRRAA